MSILSIALGLAVLGFVVWLAMLLFNLLIVTLFAGIAGVVTLAQAIYRKLMEEE